ncbi:MAG: hypothetical protein VR65_11060 [Desulfobulbaceae bacterium BRH_c16a]|nr:MAG: hypothetical protein VR65_11060 [Desulfobulbaceae bacterium BRH_c16a]
MNSAFYVGTIGHRRFIPREHRFSYHFFMWYLDLDEIDSLPSIFPWFSAGGAAFNRFHRPDYYGDPKSSLSRAIRDRMAELTGVAVEGRVCGLMNLRTLGLYFSPVNFYYGFDSEGRCSHFLAEVSNIPWNERHQYADLLTGAAEGNFTHPKVFHVSPFNPLDQQYRWRLTPPGESVAVGLEVHDRRGHIFTAELELCRRPLTAREIGKQLLKKPVMTAFIVAGIYWQAMKLYIKGVPYVPYAKETI